MAAVILLPACSIIFPDRTAPKSGEYEVTSPSSPWMRIPVGEDKEATDALKADVAFENPSTGAIISLNSLCRKYTDTSLEKSTMNLLRGIGDRELLSQEKRTIDGVEALDSKFSGVVDGVAVNIRTVVLVKDYCTYDFIHVSVPKHEKVTKDSSFDQFIASFRTK